MSDDWFSPSLILSFLSGRRHYRVAHRVCTECDCPHIYQERKFSQRMVGQDNAEFVGGRIIQPLDNVIAKITLESTIHRFEIDGNEVNLEVNLDSSSTVNGMRLNVDWGDDDILSELREGHRIELDYVQDDELSQWSYITEGNILKCGDCGVNQPEQQPALSLEFWQTMIENGAPVFYLRPLNEIIAEYEESDLSYTDLFRKYDAHPWECEIDYQPEHVLRNFMHILYDQVRTKAMEIDSERRRAYEEAFSKWKSDLPNHIDAWKEALGLEALDLHLINLYMFEEESDFQLNQAERKELLLECGK